MALAEAPWQALYHSKRTLQLTQVVLLRSERPRTGRLVAEEIHPEAMDHVDDLLAGVVDTLLCLFCRRVCANVEVLAAEVDFLAVDLVYCALLFDQVVGI